MQIGEHFAMIMMIIVMMLMMKMIITMIVMFEATIPKKTVKFNMILPYPLTSIEIRACNNLHRNSATT